jgi:hypothetical protein
MLPVLLSPDGLRQHIQVAQQKKSYSQDFTKKNRDKSNQVHTPPLKAKSQSSLV